MTKQEKIKAEQEEQEMLDAMMYEYLHGKYPPKLSKPWGIADDDWEDYLSHFPDDFDWENLSDSEFEYMIRNL